MAKDERDVITIYIPGTFLQTNLKGERVHVRFEEPIAKLMATIDPKFYRPHIFIEKGKHVIYAELQRVLFSMLQSALRFWEQVLVTFPSWASL